MKLRHTFLAAALVFAVSAATSHAAVTESFSGGNKSVTGTLDLTAWVPYTVTSYGSGSYFFFDSGEGTGDGISVSGVSGQFPVLKTFYVETQTGTQISLSGGESNPSPVPLPAAFLLLGSGLAGLVGLRRRLSAEAA